MNNDSCSDASQTVRLSSMEYLAAAIAHEVNQPLTAICVNADSCLRWLDKKPPDMGMARQAAERIISNGHYASEVIRNIRATLGDANAGISLVDLHSVISDALQLMGSEIDNHCITLQTQLCDQARFARADRIRIQQVLINLIRNSVDAMRGSEVLPRILHVKTSFDSTGEVSIAVSDTGPGFDAADEQRIFDPFFTTKNGGTGLGLAICRSIILAHGGQLRALPRIPCGCTFEITLPVHGQC